MERLNKTAPRVELTAEQKATLAELDSKYAAKLAEREIFLSGQLEKARTDGDVEAMQQIERQLTSDRKSIQAEMEEKKDAVRASGRE